MPSARVLRSDAPPRRAPAAPTTGLVIGVAAAVAALGLAGQGLLLPAGSSNAMLRVLGALVATVAAGLLVRLDGPLDGTRSLAVVSVVGLVIGVATLPWSPVDLSSPSSADPSPVTPSPDGRDSVVLDQVGPGQGDASVLSLPPGASVSVEDGRVVLRTRDGAAAVVGRAAPAPDAGATGDGPGGEGSGEGSGGEGSGSSAPGSAGVVVTVVDGVVGRSDGRAIGGEVALGGITFEAGDGTRFFVGDGRLLPVPAPPIDDVADGVDAVLAMLLLAFAVVAFAPPVVRLADRVVGPVMVDEPDVPEPAPSPPVTVEAGVAEVLRSMLADPDPRTAVIGAYARLLVALAAVGFARRDEEAPHEHLWRSLGPLGVRPAPVHRLAELFVRARFTPHPVTETHRQAAIAALADTVADLRLRAAGAEDAEALDPVLVDA